MNKAKLLFATNKICNVKDSDDEAYYERWIILFFNRVFEGKNADRDIIEKLATPEELSGFLNLAIDGLYRIWENRGFSYNKTADDNKLIMEWDSNSVSAFIQDCLIKDDDSWILKSDLYLIYADYANARDISKISEDLFFKTFLKKCNYAVSEKPETEKGRKNGYSNICLKDLSGDKRQWCQGFWHIISMKKKLLKTGNNDKKTLSFFVRREENKALTPLTLKDEIYFFIKEAQDLGKKASNDANLPFDGLAENNLYSGFEFKDKIGLDDFYKIIDSLKNEGSIMQPKHGFVMVNL
jgi:hypothetical protein